MKRCYRCKEYKKEEFFYKDASRYDDLHSRCKVCEKLYRREKRVRNPKLYVEFDRKYRNKHKKEINEKNKQWLISNKNKKVAHRIVANALRSGQLRKRACERCLNNKTEAHHKDYGQPLLINWLCRKHHRLETHP
jgi:hypothetical protein